VGLYALLSACAAPQRPPPTPSPTVTATHAPAQRTATAAQATRDASSRAAGAAQATSTAAARPTASRTSPPPTAPPTLTTTPAFPVATILPQTPASATPTGEPDFIRSFAASPTLIDPGGSFTLTWEAEAEVISLCSVWITGQLGACEQVGSTGSREVATRAADRNFVMWMLFAQSGDVTDQATVTVNLTCPEGWFFSPPPDESCPQPATHSAGAAQRFEHGLMIWIAAFDSIYALYSDDIFSPKWERYSDPWVEGLPEEDPSIEPPPGLYEPMRGFGMVWRGDASIIVPRDRLGWALGPEFPLDTAYQCDSAPRYNTCFLIGPDGLLELEPERSAWHPYP
jgi:hypothetical protein